MLCHYPLQLCLLFFQQRYSTLIIHLLLERSPAAYFIDYYLPSTLLVVMSWVNFYFAPDALPARTTLGKTVERSRFVAVFSPTRVRFVNEKKSPGISMAL